MMMIERDDDIADDENDIDDRNDDDGDVDDKDNDDDND